MWYDRIKAFLSYCGYTEGKQVRVGFAKFVVWSKARPDGRVCTYFIEVSGSAVRYSTEGDIHQSLNAIHTLRKRIRWFEKNIVRGV